MTSSTLASAPSSRLIPLEACRGIAALIVVIHHFFLAFAPAVTGFMPNFRDAQSLIGQSWFFLFNGTGAVYFFFTLSGFVLSWSFFNKLVPEILVKSAIKRVPRLIGLTTLVTLISYLLFKFDLYHYQAASALNHSEWLATFGYAGLSPDFSPDLLKALAQGVLTFFMGITNYNSNMWTMRVELQGSLLVYALAMFVSQVRHPGQQRYLLLICLATTLFGGRFMFPFAAGAALSFMLSQSKMMIPRPLSWLLLGLGLYLLGYCIPERHYAWVALVPAIFRGQLTHALNTAGALMVIMAIMGDRRLFLSLSHQIFAFLGKISFPIYLIHTIVIASVSSALMIWLHSKPILASMVLPLLFGVTMLTCVVLSWPLSRFDDAWSRWVDRITPRV